MPDETCRGSLLKSDPRNEVLPSPRPFSFACRSLEQHDRQCAKAPGRIPEFCPDPGVADEPSYSGPVVDEQNRAYGDYESYGHVLPSPFEDLTRHQESGESSDDGAEEAGAETDEGQSLGGRFDAKGPPLLGRLASPLESLLKRMHRER